MRPRVVVWLIGGLLAAPVAANDQEADLTDALQQARSGHCSAAMVTLDGMASRLRADRTRARDLARAYVYLAAAHLACAQEASARAILGDALRADSQVRPTGAADTPELAAMLASLRSEKAGARAGWGTTAWAAFGASATALGVGGYLMGERFGRNDAPDIPVIKVTPDVGVAGVTAISVAAPGNDREGDPISYAWDLGDGSGSAAASLSHVYAQTGSYVVRLEASDGRHRVSPPPVTVAIRDLTGTWRGTMTGLPDFTLNLQQAGSAIFGTFSQGGRDAALISGKVTSPDKVQMAFRHDLHTRLIECTLTADLNACVGTHRPPETTIRIWR
jgi:hypothetical protein